jgi:polyisoprenoid-binding protein YceI
MKLKRTTYAAIAAVAGAAVTLMIVTSDAQPKPTKVVQAPKLKTQLQPIPKGIDGKWNLDPMHSTIGFTISHMMINDVHGTFNQSEGTVIVDEKDFRKSSVNFKAKVASIDTNVEMRDKHLRSADFFDVEKYPEMTFRSTRVDRTSTGFSATGIFTLKGVQKRIVIPFTAKGPITDPQGAKRASVRSRFTINRQDYGIKYNSVLDNGSLSIGNTVNVVLDLEAVKEGSGRKRN